MFNPFILIQPLLAYADPFWGRSSPRNSQALYAKSAAWNTNKRHLFELNLTKKELALDGHHTIVLAFIDVYDNFRDITDIETQVESQPYL